MSDIKYPDNSHKYREKQKELSEQKKVTKVASGKTKKKSGGRKLADVFVAEDISDVKTYIFTDVLVPAIVDAVEDIVVKGIRMILRGEAEPRKKRSGEFVNYSGMSSRSKRDDRYSSKSSSSRFDFDEIIFDTRGEAEAVRDQMEAIIDEYGVVTVADLYDMADLTAPPYTSNKYGWSNLRHAEVVRVRGGYIIKLPRAMPFD